MTSVMVLFLNGAMTFSSLLIVSRWDVEPQWRARQMFSSVLSYRCHSGFDAPTEITAPDTKQSICEKCNFIINLQLILIVALRHSDPETCFCCHWQSEFISSFWAFIKELSGVLQVEIEKDPEILPPWLTLQEAASPPITLVTS